MQKIYRSQLENGVELLVVPQQNALSVAVSVLVRAGTAYESKKENGISHFLEHMFFKGTATLPTPLAIASAFENIGASYNASTGRDVTEYYAKAAPRHADKITKLLWEMYNNSLLDEKMIEKEKGVIVEELHMYEDDPRSKAGQLLEHALFGDQHAGWDIGGTESTVRAISRDTLARYKERRYVGRATTVVIAGAISLSHARALAREYFGALPTGSTQKGGVVTQKSKKRALGAQRKLDQSHLAIGCPTISSTSPWRERYAQLMMASVLGRGMSSRLFQSIREEMGAAYYVGAYPHMYMTHGYLEVYAGLSHGSVEEAVVRIGKELGRLRGELVSQKELKRAQEYIAGSLLVSLDTPQRLAGFYGAQIATGEELETPRQVASRIRSITPKQIQSCAKKFLKPENLRFSIVGPLASKASSLRMRLIREMKS